MSRKKSRGLWELFKTVGYAVLIALAVRTLAYEPFNIPSGSMVPTLLVGDYLFVSKFSYGYSSHSLPWSLPLVPGRVFFQEPARGDVVVFKLPRDNETDYIKRIIGLPGDRVQVLRGIVHLNGEPVMRVPIANYNSGFRLNKSVRQYVETLPNGRRHRMIEAEGDTGPNDDTQVFTVPAGHYFAMGDNRDNSSDSRSTVGFIPAVNLIGRAEFLFFSTNGKARWWEVWNWPRAIRYGRLFQPVE